MIGTILILSLVLWVLCVFIYAFGALLGNHGARDAALGGIAGILIGLISIIIISIFELTVWGIVVFIICIFILVPILRSGGVGTIYSIALIMVFVGYLFAGPYSGYMKSLMQGTSAPVDLAVNQMWNMGYDLWLMATDPQAYVTRQMMSNVKTEDASVGYPKGVEFERVAISPDTSPPEGEFYVEVYAKNEGEMPANVILSASCNNRLCCVGDSCDNSEATTVYYPNKTQPITLDRYEAINEQIGPFKVASSSQLKKTDLGKMAEVNVTIHYAHSTSSSLMVQVMSKDEIYRQSTDPVLGEQLYKTVTPTGKNAPGMVAITVGYQPLAEGKKVPMTVSVVNKRPKGDVVLGKDAKLQITLPPKIGSGMTCSAPGVSCTSDGQVANCQMTMDVKISPTDKLYPIICYFNTPETVDTQVSDAVTANLSGYTFQETQKVGTRIMTGFVPAGDTYTTSGGSQESSGTETGQSGSSSTTTTIALDCAQQCINNGYAGGSGADDNRYCVMNFPHCSGSVCQHSCTIINNVKGYSTYCYCYREDSVSGCNTQTNCGTNGPVSYTTTTMQGGVDLCCSGDYQILIGAYDTPTADVRCTDFNGKGCVNGATNCNVIDCRTYGDNYSCSSTLHMCSVGDLGNIFTPNTIDPRYCTRDYATRTYVGSGCGKITGIGW